jgi:hypothetical protein
VTAKGGFFAIGKPQWNAACTLGINQAAALLVLACGTGHDNSTTSWSAKAVETHANMSWRRANLAIPSLIDSGLLVKTRKGMRPSYKIAVPAKLEDLIWLPNEIVTGAADETPPLARIKQTRDADLLRMFVSLYGEHDLPGDGGLPRWLIRGDYDREQIATHGQFVFYGFKRKGAGTAFHQGPFEQYRGSGEKLWPHVDQLTALGLLEPIVYLAESAESDSELIHALTGDEHARSAYKAAQAATECKAGYVAYRSDDYDFTIPVFAHMKGVTVVEVYRLRYRPKTTRTAAWYAEHVKQCEKFQRCYTDIFGSVQSAAA